MYQLEESIFNFSSLNLIYDNREDIFNNLRKFNSSYSKCFDNIEIPTLSFKSNRDYSFFRVRRLSEIKDPFLSDRMEYSYPKELETLGRANLPHNPVFYCSLTMNTAFNEIRRIYPNCNSFAISKWKKRRSSTNLRLVEAFPKNDYGFINKLLDIFKLKPKKLIRSNYLSFMGQQFLNHNNSTISAYLTYRLWVNDEADIVAYPSIVDYKGTNMAIQTEVIDNKDIVMDKVYIVELQPDNSLNLLKVGVFTKGSVGWQTAVDLSLDHPLIKEFIGHNE